MGEMMNMSAASSPSSGNRNKLDRKTVERNRRIHMKGLCLRLTSLVPPHYFKPSRVHLFFPLISALHNTFQQSIMHVVCSKTLSWYFVTDNELSVSSSRRFIILGRYSVLVLFRISQGAQKLTRTQDYIYNKRFISFKIRHTRRLTLMHCNFLLKN